MKTRQRSVRIYEIITENYDKFVKFFISRESILKKYFLVVRTNNEDIKNFLKDKNSEFEYRVVRPEFEASNEEIDEIDVEKQPQTKENEKKACENNTKTEIFDRIIRSGEEINSTNKLIFLKRINAGAKIISTDSIEIFDNVEGLVKCSGKYMIVKNSEKGTIIFNSEEIKVDKLSFITKEGIKEL